MTTEQRILEELHEIEQLVATLEDEILATPVSKKEKLAIYLAATKNIVCWELEELVRSVKRINGTE